MEAFRSQNKNDILIVHGNQEVSEKIFLNNSTHKVRALAQFFRINEETLQAEHKKPTWKKVEYVVNEPKDKSLKGSTNLIFEDSLYNRIECPNQVKEMLSAPDKSAVVLAYDLLKHHSQELSGTILIQ